MTSTHETAAVRRALRAALRCDRYSLLKPDVWQTLQERQRAMLRCSRGAAGTTCRAALLEVGCGSGGNLLELLRWASRRSSLTGVELLPDAHARRGRAAAALTLSGRRAASMAAELAGHRVVSTVFSSLLDDAFQQRSPTRCGAG
jgi:cyclopropane fatty-acyl-phospholipid synthase-like methyltransferase